MGDLEEKLNSILSDPNAMSQIMQLAQSFSHAQSAPTTEPPPPPCSEPLPEEQDPDLFSAPGALDPRIVTLALKLLTAYRSDDDDRAALLRALRPYVRPERYAHLDQAIQISRLTRLIRIALNSIKDEYGGGGHFGSVS